MDHRTERRRSELDVVYGRGRSEEEVEAVQETVKEDILISNIFSHLIPVLWRIQDKSVRDQGRNDVREIRNPLSLSISLLQTQTNKTVTSTYSSCSVEIKYQRSRKPSWYLCSRKCRLISIMYVCVRWGGYGDVHDGRVGGEIEECGEFQ